LLPETTSTAAENLLIVSKGQERAAQDLEQSTEVSAKTGGVGDLEKEVADAERDCR
jgi:hypothetical protein